MIKQILFLMISFGLLSGSVGNTDTKYSTKVSSSLQYNIVQIDKEEMEFGVSETRPTESDFYINSNFFTTTSPIGLVVINNKRKSRRVKGGGFFYVKNSKPYVRSKRCPRWTEFSSQTILWGIDDGKVNTSLLKKSHSKGKRYRTLMGEDINGDIVIISSNRIGLVTIEEIIDFSMKYNIVDGILLDGGTSVDYKFTDENGSISFSSVPDNMKNTLGIKKPTTYIYANFK
tara:strand:- start:4626 stop:5315 length:690 start_codon:yes stop_codon:yes gene_type:complete